MAAEGTVREGGKLPVSAPSTLTEPGFPVPQTAGQPTAPQRSGGYATLELGNSPFDDVPDYDEPRHAVRASDDSSRRRVPVPLKRVGLAVALLLIGVGMTVTGAFTGVISILVVGLLSLVPGAFMSWVYFQIWRGNPNYRPEQWYEVEEVD